MKFRPQRGGYAVHVRHAPFTLYIGRKCKEFPASKWANPFKLRDNTPLRRQECLVHYENYVHLTSLWDDLHELDGHTLGCWCHPKECHGDVLIRLRQEQLGNEKTLLP